MNASRQTWQHPGGTIPDTAASAVIVMHNVSKRLALRYFVTIRLIISDSPTAPYTTLQTSRRLVA
jgi:hypothetical protein